MIETVKLSIFTKPFERENGSRIEELHGLDDHEFRSRLWRCRLCSPSSLCQPPYCSGTWETATNLFVVKDASSYPVASGFKQIFFKKYRESIHVRENDYIIAGICQCMADRVDFQVGYRMCLPWLREIIMRASKLETIYLCGADPYRVLLGRTDSTVVSKGATFKTVLPDERSLHIKVTPAYLYWRST